MNFRHVILTVFVLCGVFSAAAQTLVIYDARDLFPKDAWNPPCKAVFTEDYYYSEEWLSLKDRIDTYLLYQTAKENPDWIPLADDEFRQKIEQGKNMTPEGLRKAICRHAVGGRMFVGAELEYRNRLVSVREKPFTEAEAFDGVTPYANAWGVMNAKGQMIIPFEYQNFGSSWNSNTGDYLRFIIGYKQVSGTASDGKFDVVLFLPSGKRATDTKLDYAQIEMGNDPDEHRLIVRIPGEGFTIMDEYCNILTTRRYDELKAAKFYCWPPDPLYWARKGKTYYLIDILTGREQGSFTFSRRDKENIFFDVKVSYFK